MSDSGLLIRQYEIGMMENFVYFIGDPKTREVLVVDPAWEVDTILKHAAEEDVRITGALITHHHYDHTNGIADLLAAKDMPVYINKLDIPYLMPDVPRGALTPVHGGEKIRVGAVEVDLIHTPGHTPGSQCFHVRNHLVSGDTLFIGACGRCDFKESDPEEMYKSLHERLGKMPAETLLLPGHNYADRPTSTMGRERETNPYLMVDSLQNFLRFRLG